MKVKVEHRDRIPEGVPEGHVEIETLAELVELLLKLGRAEVSRLEDGTLRLWSNTDYD